MKTPPQYIRVKGQLYHRLGAGKKISNDDVKENINKAADRAAIENIVKNLEAHAQHIQQIASTVLGALDDKSEADSIITKLEDHCDVMVRFLDQLSPTYKRYHRKHKE